MIGQVRATNPPGALQAAWRIAAIYLLIGLAWVLLSDRLLDWWFDDRRTVQTIQTYKGYLFITGTATLIFLLVDRHIRRLVQAYKQQRTVEQQFRNAFEHAVTGMALVSPDLRFTRVNGVLCSMLGLSEEALLGRSIAEIVHPAERGEPVRHLESLLHEGAESRQLEVRCRHREGRTLWVLMNATLQRDERGRPLYFISQFVDVTARHEAEEQARRQQLELARAARLISLGKISSIVAHELNQPLGAIMLYSQACRSLLEEDGDDGSRARLARAMEDVVRQTERATRIVRRVRAMAKKQTPRAVPIDANHMVHAARGLIEPQLDRYRVSCRMELTPELPAVAADPQQIEQVLVNLLTNAIEAVVEQPGEARWVLLRTRAEGDRVWITVRDGGRGFTDQTAERLFESFFTTKEHGLGLGLAISKSLVEEHGGQLAMHRGETWTEFEFSLLPAVKATWLLNSPEPPETPPSEAMEATKTVEPHPSSTPPSSG